MTEQRPVRERLRELAGWASAPPWHQYVVTGQYVKAGSRTVADFRYTNGVADAAYVVAAVNALPALLTELDTLERQAKYAEGVLARLCSCPHGSAGNRTDTHPTCRVHFEELASAARSLISEGSDTDG